jgi:outer membrane protein OmpA-like peptidoglycan-associated protein
MQPKLMLLFVGCWVSFGAISQEDAHTFNEQINSPAHELFPTISADGKHLIFASDRNNPNVGALKFYESRCDSTQHWSIPKPISILNDSLEDSHLHIPFIHQSHTLFFSALHKGKKDHDIYVSTLQDSLWSAPQSLDGNINTFADEISPSFTTDGLTLYFIRLDDESQQKEEHYLAGKIYTCQKQKTGKWSKPQLLPEPINHTPCHTVSILLDDKTLVFSSQRPDGKGGLDLYVSQLQKDGSWPKPENLYFWNSIHDDVMLCVTENFSKVYVANDRVKNSYASNHNIYEIKAKFPHRNLQQISVGGMVRDIETGVLLEAEITFKSIKNTQNKAQIHTTEGLYQTQLMDGELYLVEANAIGYHPFRKYMDLVNLEESQEVHFSIEMLRQLETSLMMQETDFDDRSAEFKIGTFEKLDETADFLIENPENRLVILMENTHLKNNEQDTLLENSNPSAQDKIMVLSQERGIKVTNYFIGKGISKDRISINGNTLIPAIVNISNLNAENIYFDYNSARLKEKAFAELDNLMLHPTLKLEIAAHTDNEGTEEDNLVLSQKRAETVYYFLLEKGIAKDRLLPKGYGETQLLNHHAGFENKALNRRVEVRIWERLALVNIGADCIHKNR